MRAFLFILMIVMILVGVAVGDAFLSAAAIFERPILRGPSNGKLINETPIIFTWSKIKNEPRYQIDISLSADFNKIIITETVIGNTYTLRFLDNDGIYYWRVKLAGLMFFLAPWSEVYKFTYKKKLKDQVLTELSQSEFKQPIFRFRNWVSYYGSNKIEELKKFELVVIDADKDIGNYTDEELRQLRDSGSLVVSYLNIGSCETFRTYWYLCQKFKLKPYKGYSDEYWMDVTNIDYQNFIVNILAKNLVSQGINGLYLDNIDIYQESFNGRTIAEIKAGLANIIVALRRTYPDLLLIAQNGVYASYDDILYFSSTITDSKPLYTFIDGESHEEVFTNTSETQSIVSMLQDLKSKGLFILNLEYLEDLQDIDRIRDIYNRSIQNGFLPYISDVKLDKIYLWNF